VPPVIVKPSLRTAFASVSASQRHPGSVTLVFTLRALVVKSDSAFTVAKVILVLASEWLGFS